MPRRLLRWIPTAALAAATALALAGPAAAQQVTLRVDSAAGNRPILRLGAALDAESLREAIASGIPIRLYVRVELWRDGFFDDLAGSRAFSTVLVYEPLAREYLIRGPGNDDRALRFPTFDAARAAIEGDRLIDLRPTREGTYYYTATVVIETLSLSDLQELERWLQGELQPAVSGDRSIPGALGEGAKRLVIRLLRLPTRRLEARSPRFGVSSESLPDPPLPP